MSILSDARTALYTIIETAVPGISTIWDSDNVNRYSWRELVDNWEKSVATLDVQPPFAVVRWGAHQSTDIGPVNGQCYVQQVWIYYLTGLRSTSTGAAKTQEALMAEIEDALLALVSGIRSYSSGAFVELKTSIDTGDMSEINQYLLSKNLSFMCGVVATELHVGQGV